MLKKLFIVPWFGEFPNWIDKYLENIKHLEKQGYDWLITTDLDDFIIRAKDRLGVNIPFITPGNSKSHDLRSAFGLMFEDKLRGYDFWGITDLDCVYGDISAYLSEKMLNSLDIHSNHHNYICGPWTLFRNTEKINNLFRLVPNWKDFMECQNLEHPGRWTEQEFSKIVDEQHISKNINRLYTHFQAKDPNDSSQIVFKNGKLYDHNKEIMMHHFNRIKRWPL